MSDRVAVMYLGRIVEEGAKTELYGRPLRPYTQALLSAVPAPEVRTGSAKRRIVLEGEIPDPAAPPTGCHFHPRCFRASAHCRTEAPAFEQQPPSPTWRACHHAGPPEPETALGGRP